MFGSAPQFWWKKPGLLAWALHPLAWIYGRIAVHQFKKLSDLRAPIPVICIGNFTVGGSGKTPLALAFAKAAKSAGLKPGFITRGHGGTVKKSRLAFDDDTSFTIGDEAILLFKLAPVAIGKDRLTSAKLLADAGCTIAIMDDGFQSRTIAIDHALVAVDARRGAGNGFVLPAGPLRAPLLEQIPYADQIVVVGDGDAGDSIVRIAARAGKPVSRATLVPRNIGKVKGQRIMAFAGIADPAKFYATLHSMGAIIVKTRSFPDHHPFEDAELRSLMDDAGDLVLVTTEKDAVRIDGASELQQSFRKALVTIPVQIQFLDDTTITRAFGEAQKSFRQISR